MNASNKVWKSMMILGQDDWQIDIVLGHHKTEDEATKTAQDDTLEAMLDMHEGDPAILVTSKTGGALYLDGNVVITEISQEKKAKMGPPLDMSNPINKDIALEALKNRDPAYTIYPDDMVPSTKTLVDFINQYGAGYKLDHIGWGAVEACDSAIL
jgi:hypothetical protein